MNRKTVVPIVGAAIVMVLALNGFSADLDAPAVKHVTVRSEIRRGADIVNAVDIDPLNLLDLSKLQDAIDREQAKNTDTEAFYLGAYFTAWIQAAVAIISNEEQPGLQNDKTMSVANQLPRTGLRNSSVKSRNSTSAIRFSVAWSVSTIRQLSR